MTAIRIFLVLVALSHATSNAARSRRLAFGEIMSGTCTYIELAGRRNSDLSGFNHFGLVVTCSNGYWLLHGYKRRPVVTFIDVMSHRWVILLGYAVKQRLGSYYRASINFEKLNDTELAMNRMVQLPGLPVTGGSWQLNVGDDGMSLWYDQNHFTTGKYCLRHNINRLQYFKTQTWNASGINRVRISVTYLIKGCQDVVNRGCTGNIEVYAIRAKSPSDISKTNYFSTTDSGVVKLTSLSARKEKVSPEYRNETIQETLNLGEWSYLAIGFLDKGTCMDIYNVTVFPYQCSGKARNLALYSHVFALVDNVSINNGSCIENAIASAPKSLQWECSSLGIASYGEGCMCKDGYKKIDQACVDSNWSTSNKTVNNSVLLRHIEILKDQNPETSKLNENGANKTLISTVAVTSFVVCLLIVIVSVYLIRKRKWKDGYRNSRPIEYDPDDNSLESLDELVSLQTDKMSVYSEPPSRLKDRPEYVNIDHYEFPSENLKLLKKLGEGYFGTVYLGEALNISGWSGVSDVAVKTLKESAKAKYGEAFLFELDLLRNLGTHENVVRLVGCCTQNGPARIIFEYAEKGDLRTLLRRCRREDKQRRSYSTLPFSELLSFGSMIAKGMHFIGENGIVHRDLATRNVLVDHNLVCKISDFGLARYLNQKEIYKKGPEQARLPLEWMAPESIFQGIYSAKSDVWSFGIVLWELTSYGQSPYPEHNVSDVGALLKAKYRMPCPEGCPWEMYQVMFSCWYEQRDHRPTFGELVEVLSSTRIWHNHPTPLA